MLIYIFDANFSKIWCQPDLFDNLVFLSMYQSQTIKPAHQKKNLFYGPSVLWADMLD